MRNTQSTYVIYPKAESGAVLIVGLIMLLLITVVGLASIRGSGMQELMAGNMRDRNIAFQTTESGLRLAEGTVDSLVANPFSGNGLWEDLNVPGAPRTPVSTWQAEQWLAVNNNIVNALETNAPGLVNNPRYVIEKMSLPIGEVAAADGSAIGIGSINQGNQVPEPDYFRITSRALGGTDTTEVVLQSTYKTYCID